jgi:bacillithiol system protein YtxJ
MPEIGRNTDLESLFQEDLLVVFKHSAACPVSWAAHAQINRFRLKHPGVPIHILHVIRDRPVSMKIAEMTGVRHESPQILIFRNGEVVASASHGSITEARLAAIVTEPRSLD